MPFPAHNSAHSGAQPRTLLLAGSEAATLTEWTTRLRDCGHEPLTARDRSALLYGLQHDDHALLIVLLGAESELEWLQAARQLVTEHGLPLLAVCDSTLRERAILAGASECLPPDISTAELTMRLRGNLRSAQAIQDLERERRDHARTQRQAATGCFRFDPLSEALQFSDEGLRLLGLDAAHAPASLAQFALRLPGENRDSARNWMHACAAGTHPAPLELLWRGTNGTGQALRLCCGGLEPRGGREIVYGFLETKAEQRRAGEQRRNHDAADRERFLERLALLLSRSKAGEEHVAVLSLHISFERLGALSAEALEHVRERTEARLAEQTRDRDLFGDCLADSQAENVAILLPELSRPHDAYKVARRLQEDLHKPIVHAGHSHLVEVTIGIALAGADAANPAALLHEAREAEHEARDEQGGKQRAEQRLRAEARQQALGLVAEARLGILAAAAQHPVALRREALLHEPLRLDGLGQDRARDRFPRILGASVLRAAAQALEGRLRHGAGEEPQRRLRHRGLDVFGPPRIRPDASGHGTIWHGHHAPRPAPPISPSGPS